MKNAIEIVQMAFRYDNVKEPQFREISCLLFTSMLLLQICLLISRNSLLQIQIQNIFNNIYCDVLKTIIQSSK